MGMFDEIKVNVILPDKTEVVDTWFQTRSLQNIMTKYEITSDGQLCEDTWEYKYVEIPDHFWGGYLEKIDDTYKRICLDDYHGDIVFYKGHYIISSDGSKFYRDYTARFTHGKLEKITYKDETI